MSQQSERHAHALSLHLYSVLDKSTEEGADASRIVEELRQVLKNLHLEEHLEVAFREDNEPNIGVVPKTVFGDEIVLELYSRCEFFPCPRGECEYAPKSFCKWCGKLKG